MIKIITTTQVQQKIGEVSEAIEDTAYIATRRGQGRIVMLPYFDGCDENIMDYLEDFEMFKNRDRLKNRYKESLESGESDLTI